MKLSSRSRCALRALSHLAAYAPQPRTTEQIALATQLPLPTLAKTLQVLSRGGIVKTQRGVGGGVCLSRDPSKISVLEVMETIDGCGRFVNPPDDTLCPCLYRRLACVFSLTRLVLQQTTIAELGPKPFIPGQPLAPLDVMLEKIERLAGITCETGIVSDRPH